MTTAINIKETISDKRSYFTVKRFKLFNVDIEEPLKIIDIKKVPKGIFNLYSSNFEKTIFENSKLINKSRQIINVIQSEEDEVRNKHFGSVNWAKPLAVPLTLAFNPFREIPKREIWTAYFDYYHEHSHLLFVPNVRAWKIIDKKKQWIINLKEYLEFVDTIVEILNYRNSKPIFVPISLKFRSKEKLTQILDHYFKKEYFNLWIDLEGGTLSKNNIARLRIILRHLEEKGRYEDVVIYATNIKPEIESNYHDKYTPASDPLVPLLGGNLIGGNREPQRKFDVPKEVKPPKELITLHKSRLFDPNTYYYIRPDAIPDSTIQRIAKDERHRKLLNTVRLYHEFKVQTEHLLTEGDLKKYISQKQMIKAYEEGRLLIDLFSKEPRPTVTILDLL